MASHSFLFSQSKDRNPKLKNVGRGYACYYCCMPSSPVLLHIYLVWGYACCMCCCIYTALVSLLFGTVIPTSFNSLMEVFYTCFTDFLL